MKKQKKKYCIHIFVFNTEFEHSTNLSCLYKIRIPNILKDQTKTVFLAALHS